MLTLLAGSEKIHLALELHNFGVLFSFLHETNLMTYSISEIVKLVNAIVFKLRTLAF